MKRISVAVYVMALSLILVMGMIGYVIRENRAHQDELAAAVEERERAVNTFLTEICDRLSIRDDIQISYLQVASARYALEDPDYAETLARAAQALQVTQSGCLEGIPSTEEGG